MPSDAPNAVESPAARWRRRALTLPALFLAAAVWWAALPAGLLLALAFDAVRRNRLATTRAALLMGVYLACEVAGVVASAAIFATRGRDEAVWIRRNFALQRWWAGTLFRATERLFSLRVHVEGDAAVARGPLLLFVRHASVADTLVPAVFVSARAGLLLRYVLKRELLLDPCLDIVGQRLPNAFVRRGSRDPAREIATVRALAVDLAPDEGVIVFPEGTRFSERRRAEALAKLAASDPALARRAERLVRTLPPRLGGPLALLDAAPDADVVVCGHVGFDGVRTLADLANGALVGREVRIVFWRVPRASIPADAAGRTDALYAWWERLDAWVAEHEAAPAPAGG